MVRPLLNSAFSLLGLTFGKAADYIANDATKFDRRRKWCVRFFKTGRWPRIFYAIDVGFVNDR
jgi:hypothetical protein